jgi:serine/threonine protein kinase
METPAVAKVADVIEAEQKKLETGKRFGHYEIIEQIGAGGMGEVYLAEDQKLDRRVAVKILNEKFSQDESNLGRFIQEAKAASSLNHPNILVIYEIGESDEAHYIVSEFIKGKTLREIFKAKTLKLSEVLDISIQIAGALCAAHEARLVHRDIKPENVMIRPDGYVKILDFGLAKLVEQKNKSILGLEDETAKQNQTAKGVIMGTVNYMSPEQAKGERVDERTDIFSFGVLIYEMIAGRTPFAGDSMSETFANLINAAPSPLSRFAANVPNEMQRMVSKMLRKNKDERYQTMKDVFGDLKDLRENLSSEEKLERSASSENGNATAVLQATTGGANLQTAETQYSFSQSIKRYKPLAAFGLAALLIGAIGLGYYFFFARKTPLGADGKKSIAILPLKPINSANRDEIYEIRIRISDASCG